MLHKHCFLVVALLFPFFLNGQIAQTGTPPSLTESFLETYGDQDAPAIRVPSIAYNRFSAIQATYPDFFLDGVSVDTRIDIRSEGEWTLLPNGDRLWRLKVSVKNAYQLTFLYEDFWLPKGGKFYLYSEDQTQILGAFTSDNNKESGRFSTATIYDDAVYLEYVEPMQVTEQARIHITKIVQKPKAYTNTRGDEEFGFNASADCHININCAQGESMQVQKRSISRIVMFLEKDGEVFQGYCTGNLMNNTLQDQTPYVLSAFHCIIEGFTPLYDMWQFDFGFESPTCTNPTVIPDSRTIVGCTEVAKRQDPDFLLLKISSAIPSSFNPYFSGWNATDNQVPRNTKMISHPCGDIKKITVDTRNTTTIHAPPVNWADYTSSPNTHYRVVFEEGFSQGGGSGSGLVGEDGLIYGQLHGGNIDIESCTVNRLFFGRLSTSYDGSSPTTRLKDWLDPSNENITLLEGFDPFNSDIAQISGVVRTPQGAAINGVSVEFSNEDTTVLVITNMAGEFETALPRTTSYDIHFSKEGNISNGVSTFDLVQIRQHVLGAVLFDNPFSELAADINISNSVTTFDLVEIRKAILGVYDVFPSAPSWGFVSPDGFLFNIFTINDLSPTVTFNITAIKMGDVNNTADPQK